MSIATDLQNTYTNLQGVLYNSNAALTEKGGSEVTTLTAIAAAISGLPSGSVELPTLDNPAADSDVIEGKEYINQSGEKRTGTLISETTSVWSLVDGSVTGEVSNDTVTSIRKGAFLGCVQLTSVSFPAATSVGERAFEGCTVLTSVNLPKVTKIGSYTFMSLTNLETLSLPELEIVASDGIRSCNALTSVNFPKVTSIGDTGMYGCKALPLIDFPLLSSINTQAFRGCSALAALILRNSTVCTLANTNAFTSTPFASGGSGGTVYVPSALIESYQAATNWSTLYAAGSCTFVAIEGSEYE